MGGGLGPEEAGDDLQEGGGRGTKGTRGRVGWKGEKADEVFCSVGPLPGKRAYSLDHTRHQG